MAEQLKYMYNPAFFEKICPVLKENIPGFDCPRFIHLVFNNQWPELELKQRVRHISQTLHAFLPDDFPKAAAILAELSKKLCENNVGSQGFAMMFIPDYVEVFGVNYPQESLEALEMITELVSGEFAIRPFLLRYPDQAFSKMMTWSRHESANVRRLSSEGCRPRLPWAMGVPVLKKDPTAILRILENLKEDPSEYVRRSVANNLNDIAKDHPAVVLRIASRWGMKNSRTAWIIKHGCRTLLKKGNDVALDMHGFSPASKSRIEALRMEKKRVRIGDDLNFGFTFINEEKKDTRYRLEYAIDYLTSTGKTSRKVFKITENSLAPGKSLAITRKQSFRDFTTRKHFKGKHQLTILANGRPIVTKEFLVG